MSSKWFRWLYHWLLLQTTVYYASPCSFGWRCWPCANVCPGHRPRHRPPAIGVWPNCRWRPVSCLNRYRRRLTPYSRGSNRLRTMTNSLNCHRETVWVRGTNTIRGPDRRCRLFEQIDFTFYPYPSLLLFCQQFHHYIDDHYFWRGNRNSTEISWFL